MTCVGEYDIKTPIYALVENMVEKNRNRLSIVVPIDHHDLHLLNAYKFVFWFTK